METALEDEAQSWQYAPTDSPVDKAISDAANPQVSPEDSATSEAAAINYDPAQARQQAAQQAAQERAQQSAYRVTAQDLSRRGIGYYTDLQSGAPQTPTDESGAPLTNFDRSTQVGYDSQGQPRKLAFNTQTGAAELRDPYEGAPQTTDKAGNIYTTPQGLPWRFDGVNSDIQGQNQQAQQAKLDQQTASALTGLVALAKSKFIQTQQAVSASEKSTAATLQKLGIQMTGEDGTPVDLTNAGPDQLHSMVNDSFSAEMAAPEANEKQFFGSGLSQSAQTARQDIANRQKQAQDAVDSHVGIVSAMQQAGADYDQARAPIAAISVAKLNHLNDSRVAAGLQPVQIPQELQRVAQLAPPPPIPGIDHAGIPTPAVNTSQGEPTSGSAASAPEAGASAPSSTAQPKSEGTLQSFLRPIESGIIPALGTAAGGAGGAALGGLAGIETGPGAIATAIAGDIAGGAAGGALAQKAQNAVMGGEWTAQNQAQMAENAKVHPVASLLGQAGPMLISLLGGGGAKPLKELGAGIEDAVGGWLARTVGATEGNPTLLNKAVQTISGMFGRTPSITTQGARLNAADTAQQDVTEGKSFSNVLPSAIKGAVTFGPAAFMPEAATLIGKAVKGVGMAGLMEASNVLYDHFVEGKPINSDDLKKRFGTSATAFAIQEVLMDLLGGPSAKLTEGNEPGAKGAQPTSTPASPESQAASDAYDKAAANLRAASPSEETGKAAEPANATEQPGAAAATSADSGATQPAKIVGPALFTESEGERQPIEVGNSGESHADLISRAANNGADATDAQHGFHTEDGEILNRNESANRALETGQIDQPDYENAMAREGESRGLHSQDLFSPSPLVEAPANTGEAPAKVEAEKGQLSEAAPVATETGGGGTILGLEKLPEYHESATQTHPEPTPEQKEQVEKHLSSPEAKEVIDRLKKLRGVKMTDDETGRSLETDATGTTINRRALANHLDALDSDEARQHYLVRGLDEELKHQATLLALKPAELEAIGKGLSPEERSAVESNYGSKMDSHFVAGAEAIRTFMQAAEGRGTTEAHRLLSEKAKTDSVFRQAVQKVVDLVKKIAGNKGAMSERLRDGIERTQAVLDSVNEKIATPGTKQLIPKYDRAEQGRSEPKSKLEDLIQKAIQRQMDEANGRAVLEDMEENDISPKDVVKKFWESTYDKLNDAQQKRFQKMISAVTGFHLGDVVGVRGEGDNREEFIAHKWSDAYGSDDAASEARYLEGEERGLIVLMKLANDGAGQMKEASSPSAQKVRLGKSPQLHTITEKLAPQKGDLPDEQYFRVKNDRTGEGQTVESKDMTPVRERAPEEKSAAVSRREETESEIDRRLREHKLDPNSLPDLKSKRAALKRADALGTADPDEPEAILGLGAAPTDDDKSGEAPKESEAIPGLSQAQLSQDVASVENAPEPEKSPAQKLTDQADRVGVSYSLETLKKLIRGDATAAESMRQRIRDKGEEPLGASGIRDAFDSVARRVASTFGDGKDEVRNAPIRDQIKKGYDATGTMAHLAGEQAGNQIRLDFERPAVAGETKSQKAQREALTKLDLQAARYVAEAGGDKSNLDAERQKILASPNAKLRDAHLKIIDHAISNFDDLKAKVDLSHRPLSDNTYDRLIATGEDFGKRENFVRRVTIPPEDPDAPNPLFSMGGGQGNSPKGMERARAFDTIGDAVKAGYDPGTYGIHDADQNMVTNAEKIIGGKAFIDQMHAIKSPTDGQPVLGEMKKVVYLNGNEDMRVPKGYSSVTMPGGRPLIVHNAFAPLFRALYGQSAIRNSVVGRGLLKAAALTKQFTLIGDTFHVGRVLYKAVTSRLGTPNIGKGLSLVEYRPEDLDRAVSIGEVAPHEAEWAKKNRPVFQEGLKQGLNIGRISDNLVQQASAHLLGLGKINDWIFSSLTRDQMAQTYVDFANRNVDQIGEGKRFDTRDEAIRQAAKETNELYGSLGNQGLFQNKTLQDVARLVFLAPQWAESQFRNEARSYGQGFKAAYQAARTGGKDRFTGNSVRTFAAGMVALLAANQVANFVSRGQSTFKNKEDDHKLDAWIPGGKRGFWFSPLEIAGEYAHAAFKYAAQHENPVDIASHIVNNKLSPGGRAVKEALTGRDSSGRHFLNNTDRFRAATTDAIPSPIPLNSVFEKDPRQPLGYRITRQPGAVEKQLLQSAGAKVTAAQSPRSQMFAIAQPFRADRGQTDTAGEYTELRRALDNDDTAGSKSEIKWLQDRGHSMDSISRAVGISKGGAIKPETFAGSQEREREMLAKLTPEQKDVYSQAQRDHAANAIKFLRIAGSIGNATASRGRPFQFQ